MSTQKRKKLMSSSNKRRKSFKNKVFYSSKGISINYIPTQGSRR